jgi:hypothetical protein
MRDFVDCIITLREGEDPRDMTARCLIEATIDFPRAGLAPIVWDRQQDGTYRLRQDVKDMIDEYIHAMPGYFDLHQYIDELHIVGSITTNLYTDDADIDVHIVPKMDMLPKDKEGKEEFVRKVKKWSHENPVYVGEHPLELYIQLEPEQDLLSDGLYDVLKDEWVKGPRIETAQYNPYKVFQHVMDRVREFAQKADVDLGELKRDVIDFEVLRTAIKRLPLEYKTMLDEELKGKLEEIEADIDSLLKDKKEWVDLRQKTSKPTSEEQALKDIALAKKWQDANAIFKFLNRYKYIRVITELERLMNDDRIDADEVGIIRSVLDMGSGQ